MLEGQVSANIAQRYFKNEPEIFKTIKQHALWGGIAMAIPDFGFGVFIFIGVLWHMYSSISRLAGFHFSWGEYIGAGVVVNIIVALILDILLSAVFFLEPFIMYIQFYLSGKLFYDGLKK